jgi:hypothetical protein
VKGSIIKKEWRIEELFKEDQDAFLLLPAKEYECVRYETLKADKYGYIKLDLNLYSTSPRYALSNVLAKVSYNKVEILDDKHQLVVSHSRLYGQYRKSMKWQPYLNLMAKRPTALKYTSFYDQLPEEWKNYFSSCTVAEKPEALKLLSMVLKGKRKIIPPFDKIRMLIRLIYFTGTRH